MEGLLLGVEHEQLIYVKVGLFSSVKRMEELFLWALVECFV